jgi:iron(III) transport system ATP-binding protein
MLHVRGLTKLYQPGERQGGGVRDATFDVGRDEFYTLLGPSGCGKTTTLRSIAGLEEPDAGSIEIDGRCVFNSNTGNSVLMNDRDIGMVFQSYAVWPHMTVYQNVVFPLKVSRHRHYSSAETRDRVQRALDAVGLGDLGARPAPMLSGGQQQRLALARALVAEPSLLLLDEPLSNLDAQLREEMREELRRLQRTLGLTAVYVTHDQSEALALSDRIAVMRNGHIAQIGTPDDIYYRPQSVFVATFIGKTNLIDGTIAAPGVAGALIEVDTELGRMRCYLAAGASPGRSIKLTVRPEEVQLLVATGNERPTGDLANIVHGRLANRVFLGEISEYHIALKNGQTFLARGRFPEDVNTSKEIVARFLPSNTLGLGGAA